MVSEQFIQEYNQKLLAQGKLEGKIEGKIEGLREAIETACELLGIPLTSERMVELARLDADGLHQKLVSIRQHHAWLRFRGLLTDVFFLLPLTYFKAVG